MQRLSLLALCCTCAVGARRGLREVNLASQGDIGVTRSDGNTFGNGGGIAGKNQGVGTLARGSMVTGMLTGSGGVAQSLEASMGSMVMKFLSGKGQSLRHIVEVAHEKMDVSEAVERLEGKLPVEVSSLVRLTRRSDTAGGGKALGEFSEDSLQKARKILNSMIEGAWKDLDAVVIECKEFTERNRETYSQVTTDLARLGSQIADLERKKVKATEGISQTDRTHQDIQEELEQLTQQYQATRATNLADLTIKKNDLAVFDFILNATRCPEVPEGGLLQLGAPRPPPVSVCSTSAGLELRFADPRVQAKVERMMSPEARTALREALGQALEQAPGGAELRLLQQHVRHAGSANEEPAPTSSAPTLPALPTVPVPTSPVVEKPAEDGQWKKCTGDPNCGLLHDTMASQWGKFRDLVDELEAIMQKNHDEFKKQEANLNEQISVITDSKTQHQESLGETVSSINMDTEERTEKDEQEREVQHSYDKKMRQCRERIEEITFTNICAVRKVRNAVLTHSTTSPPSKITDCDVKDWVAGECSMDCDDACPKPDPYACGGEQDLTREVIVAANEYGVKCPQLATTKKCNQFKCPVNCLMSEWSGWSKCTKDCESGLQGMSRSIITKPKNGGQFCDTVQEERTCNTGSCDRDCTLVDWSEWSPCSMACGGGFRERVREVSVPIRGMGKCPDVRNPERYEKEDCNTQECTGDERCIAKQDLLILLDGSGSLKEDGFAILRDFTANLTAKYEPEYYGAPAMRVGVILFGNGHREPDGTITPAINVMDLTADMSALRQKIMELTWQKGLTNLAQAFVLAETMLQSGGRPDAQSAVLVLSDGKYSMEYATGEKVKQLKAKSIQIFMAPVAGFGGAKELEKLKHWASDPWETNYERIPGLAALKFNADTFASTLIAKFCPNSISETTQAQVDRMRFFMKAHVGGVPDAKCAGNSTNLGKLRSVEECHDEAQDRGFLAFSYGREQQQGTCLVEKIEITLQWISDNLFRRTHPPCPGGDWVPNPFFDTWVLEPPRDRFAA